MSYIAIVSAYDSLSTVERAFAEKLVRTIVAIAEHERVRPMDVLGKLPTNRLSRDSIEMLRRPTVQAAVREMVRDIGMAGVITVDGVMTELWAIIHSNIDDYLHEWSDGQRDDIDLTDVPREKMAAIAEYNVERLPDGRVKKKAKLWNKLDAIKVWADLQDRLPSTHPYKTLKPNASGKGARLPATLSEAEAAEQYARLLAA